MALLRDVIFKRGPTLKELIKVEKDLINLKPVKRLTIKFDPFREDVKYIRNFSYDIHDPQIIQTNVKCLIKTEILTDRSPQSLHFELLNGEQIIFECENLNCLEIFKLVNKHITPLAPKSEEESKSQVSEVKEKKKK